MYAYLLKKTGLNARVLARLIHFLSLGLIFMAISVFGYSVASSIFLSKVGARGIPFAYLFMGMVFIPVYFPFSRLIDGISPGLLLAALPILGGAGALGLHFLLMTTDHIALYYAIYIYFFMLWVVLVDILLPSMLLRYFTVTELKRATTLTTLSIAAGGLAGGTLASAASRFVSSRNLLAVPAILCLLAVIQVLILNRREKPLPIRAGAESAGTVESMLELPRLIRRYPIVLLIMLSVFLFIVINCVAEYCVFTIYESEFPGSGELTAFIGAVMGGQSLLQFLVIVYLTGPMIRKFGVMRMNLLFPVMTLGSFVLMRAWFILPVAVASHTNYDALYQSVDKPVFSLNYGALPPKYAGMVHVLGDGVFYCLGLAASGLLLLSFRNMQDIGPVLLSGIVLSGLFVLVRVFISRGYLSGLLAMLSENKVEFSKVSKGFQGLSRRYEVMTENLLEEADPERRLLGFELAVRLRNPKRFIARLRRMLKDGDDGVRDAARRILADSSGRRLAALRKEFAAEARKGEGEEVERVGSPRSLEKILPVMGSPVRSVRMKAARDLVALGRPGLRAARERLHSDRWYVAETAALALCLRNRWQDERRVMAAQRQHVAGIGKCLKFLTVTPEEDTNPAILELAVTDYLHRVFDRFLLLAGALAMNRTVHTARLMLVSPDPRLRSSAMEVLISMGKDRLIVPLLPLLETWDGTRFHLPRGSGKSEGPGRIVEALASIPDRWIRLGIGMLSGGSETAVRALSENEKSHAREVSMDALFTMKKSRILEDLALDELVAIHEALDEVSFSAGETICREGEAGLEMYLLLRGSVEVRREEAGKQTLISRLEPGEFFGEMSTLDGDVRVATVTAVTDGTLLRWSPEQFWSVTDDHPEILRALCRILSQRLRIADQTLASRSGS